MNSQRDLAKGGEGNSRSTYPSQAMTPAARDGKDNRVVSQLSLQKTEGQIRAESEDKAAAGLGMSPSAYSKFIKIMHKQTDDALGLARYNGAAELA